MAFMFARILGFMNRNLLRGLSALLALLLFTLPTVSAGPLGLVLESGITGRVGYGFTAGGGLSLALEYETPLDLNILFVDLSVVGKAGFDFAARGADVGVQAKALILPSVASGLLGVGVWLDLDLWGLGSATNVFHTSFGPFMNINLDPLYMTLSGSLLSLTNGLYGFDLGFAARYYIDAFALELGLDYNTLGYGKAAFGLRFTL
jgi:hypothetical protein